MATRAPRKLAVTGAAAAALLAGGLALARAVDGGAGRTGRVIEVTVFDLRYEPEEVRARVGDTVRWIQKDAFPHTVTSTSPAPNEPGGFDRPLIAVGETVEIEMTRQGTIEYFCVPHPFMKGRIAVEG